MTNVLVSAPYMLPFMDRFTPVLEHFGLHPIIPDVHERLEAEEILRYAGQFEGTICGDDRYNADVIKACLPALKVISKWGTGIDSIDKQAAEAMGVRDEHPKRFHRARFRKRLVQHSQLCPQAALDGSLHEKRHLG